MTGSNSTTDHTPFDEEIRSYLNTLHILNSVISLCLLTVGIASNAVTLILFLRSTCLRQKKYILLAHLTVLCFLTCFTELAYTCMGITSECTVMGPLTLTVITCQTLLYGNILGNIILLAVDKFVRLFRPLRYESLMSKKRVLKVIIVNWIFISICAVTVGMLSTKRLGEAHCYGLFIVPEAGMEANLAVYRLTAMSVAVLYGKILHLAKMQRIAIAQQEVRHPQPTSSEVVLRKHTQVPPAAGMRGSRVILVVIMCYVALWLPQYTVMMLVSRNAVPTETELILSIISHNLLLVNLFMNNLLYVCLDKHFRHAYSEISCVCGHAN